jgi:hypothetical protein
VNRRRLLLLVLLVGSLVLGVGAWLVWPRTAITRENAAKIHVGMTLAEAEAILGGLARDEMTGRILSDEFADEPDKNQRWRIWDETLIEARKQGLRELQWRSDHVLVWVLTDPAGRVFGHHVMPLRRESLLERLRRLVGL